MKKGTFQPNNRRKNKKHGFLRVIYDGGGTQDFLEPF